MFSSLIFYLSSRFGKSVRRTRFTKVSYWLSIIAFVLATLAIALITTILNSMQQFQKERLLNYTPQIIVTFNQPLASNGQPTADLEQAYQLLSQSPLKEQINQLNLYAGGKFFMQVDNNLIEGQVLGLDNQDPQTRKNLNAHSKAPINIPEDVAQLNLAPSSFTLAIPESLAYNYRLSVGDQVTLINSEKSTYLPTGFMPVMRQFTISYIYQDQGLNNTWYTNVYDIARLNLERNLHQLNIFLKDPLAIDKLMPKLAQYLHLTYQGDFSYQGQAQTNKLAVTQASDWRQRLAIIFSSIKTEGQVTTTLTSLLIIIAILSCLITFSFIIVEKDRDIAILNVLGMPTPSLNKVFLLMVLGLLIRANIFSLILFILATSFWSHYNIYLNIRIPLQIDYFEVAFTYLSCSAIIFLATAIAGYFIIRIRPAQILR
ncbi:ABC transporter permease [Psittacicella gerlachiana]|uniref:ABC3 transporter permease C-terminal domain-containing protein n=1 Tax=Psittacicella gerlachiana TaxID=2028574 RepID=A0A3A1YNM9_9GAMM|nr:FtsX-like permease family protein [Psittacicella gerlachiana]RIY38570.1 hypothetical protein CKF59_00595 [Psittacicella gerlachiana]